jgi:hypothetical protein
MHSERQGFGESRPPTAAELLRAVAASRGWSVGGGLPDEARAGRLLLKDYTSGRLLHLEWPPGYQPKTNRAVPATVPSATAAEALSEESLALAGQSCGSEEVEERPTSASTGGTCPADGSSSRWHPEVGDDILLGQHAQATGAVLP